MDDIARFEQEVANNIRNQGLDADLRCLTNIWIRESHRYYYSYNYTWLGLPIFQFPQDMVAMQEIIWQVRPDLIIETGIARGGSLVFYASLLELLGGEGKVVGIDIDLREHNRRRLADHPMMKRITLVNGSSIDEAVVGQVRELARGRRCVLVALDSNHTHAHVLQELRHYAPLVTKGSYLVVFDTAIEDMPNGLYPNRPWGKGDNPKTAVLEFLRGNPRFQIDHDIEGKLLITVAPSGYLRCIAD